MYNYMVLSTNERKLFRDFLAYYKKDPADELYFVSATNPEYLQYLEEFLERRMN